MSDLLGLFNSFGQNPPVVAAGIELVRSSGWSTPGAGAARYVYDSGVDSSYVAANPRTSFLADDGRGFRLSEHYVTVAMFGGISGTRDQDTVFTVTDQSAALQAFFDYVAGQEVPPIADFTGAWGTSQPITINQPVARATIFICGAIVATNGSSGVNLVTIADARRSVFIGEFIARGLGGAYTFRTWINGIYLKEVARAQFQVLRAIAFKNWGVFCDGDGVDGSQICTTIHFVQATDCGSVHDNESRKIPDLGYTNRTDTGSANSMGQRSVLTVGAGNVPDELEVGEMLVINGEPRWISALDDTAGTIEVYPWVTPTGPTTGTIEFNQGGAIILVGGNNGSAEIGGIDAISCGTTLASTGLYAAHVRNLQSQFCGITLRIGPNPTGSNLSLTVTGVHSEATTFDLVMLTIVPTRAVISGLSVWGAGGPLMSRCVQLVPLQSDGTPTSAAAIRGLTIIAEGETYEGNFSLNYTNSGSTEILSNRPGDRVRHINRRNDCTVKLSWVDALAKSFGDHHWIRFTVSGTGANYQPTGTITIEADSAGASAGYTVNGASSISVGSLTGPTEFLAVFDKAEENWMVSHVIRTKS